jgi:CRP-like cAMP-binding protein
MEYGERRVMERGETLEEAGEPSRWVAYVERGCFKYIVHNDEEGKDYCTGFAFEGEFVADYPYCLNGDKAEVTIEADMACVVHVIEGAELKHIFEEDPKKMRIGWEIMRNLFMMVYARDLDHYRYTARGRYRRLLERCPQVVQMLSLKDIASFLNVTPVYLSKIRKEITFG